MPHASNTVECAGPDSPHAFDNVSLQPRNGTLDARCPICRGYGQWNTEIDLVSFRCKRAACGRCYGVPRVVRHRPLPSWISAPGDIAGLSAQPQESVAAMMKVVADMPKAKRIAVLTGSPIVRMQLSRVMQQPYLRMVTDRDEAQAWLTREVEPARAA